MGSRVRVVSAPQLIDNSSQTTALKQLRVESTDPAAKPLGQPQPLLEHESECTTVLPDLSFHRRTPLSPNSVELTRRWLKPSYLK